MARKFRYNIMTEIRERWSSRAFRDLEVKEEDLMAILEAASYAPSCFNEQPWRFILASTSEELKTMRSLLVDSNYVWAKNAPVLIAIIAKKNFDYNNNLNRWHQFDAGTAWGYLSLEAWRRGYLTHAMGGFRKGEALKQLNIPEDYELITIVALGVYGNKENLPEELQLKDIPNERKPLEELIYRGTFK